MVDVRVRGGLTVVAKPIFWRLATGEVAKAVKRISLALHMPGGCRLDSPGEEIVVIQVLQGRRTEPALS
jgi:hypothetical protein